MNILLVHPPAMDIYGRFKPAAKLAAQPQMPLGILYLGAVLEQAGHRVAIVDGDVDQMGPLEIAEHVGRWGADVVGVSATTPVYAMANRVLAQIKAAHPGIVTVLGGFHLTALPQQTMAETSADFGVYGEGEQTILELLAAVERGDGWQADRRRPLATGWTRCTSIRRAPNWPTWTRCPCRPGTCCATSATSGACRARAWSR